MIAQKLSKIEAKERIERLGKLIIRHQKSRTDTTPWYADLMTILFIGFLKHASAMVFGQAPADMKTEKESIWLLLPPAMLIILVLCLSFYIPPFLYTLLGNIAAHY